MSDEPIVRVTLRVCVPTSDSPKDGRLTLSEMITGLSEIPSIKQVLESDAFVGSGYAELFVDIAGKKHARHKADRAIGRFFKRNPYQLRSQSYDLIAMHAD